MINNSKPNHYKFIFGPVPSRRLGFSLGIDVVPFKTCSYDCIYCQLGKTTGKTIQRKEFVPVKEVIKELKHKLKQKVRIDYITFSGSGEPTLYSGLGELISRIKRITDKPVAVLTNGSLLWVRDIQKSLKMVDIIIPSLDAGNKEIFHYVNRPCKGLDLNKVINGMIEFAGQCGKNIWLEVFLLNGVTSVQAEVENINSIIKKINPAKVQLNTVKRPPAESFALSIPEKQMRELAAYIDTNVEIITDFNRQTNDAYITSTKDEIINLLKRRPCSLEDISGGLNLHINEIHKYIDELLKNKKIIPYKQNHTLYYTLK